MSSSMLSPGERVRDVRFSEDSILVDLEDGRMITAPLAWYPRLLAASPDQLENWETSAGGYGIHWPDLDTEFSDW